MAHIEQYSRDKPVTPSIEMLARFCANTQIIICSLPKDRLTRSQESARTFTFPFPALMTALPDKSTLLRNPLPNAMPVNNEVSAQLLK